MSQTKNKFIAVLVNEEDKRFVQECRSKYKLPEKLMMKVLLESSKSVPEEVITALADLARQSKPQRKKTTNAADTSEQTNL